MLRPAAQILIKINQLNVGFMLNAHDSHGQRSPGIENAYGSSHSEGIRIFTHHNTLGNTLLHICMVGKLMCGVI